LSDLRADAQRFNTDWAGAFLSPLMAPPAGYVHKKGRRPKPTELTNFRG